MTNHIRIELFRPGRTVATANALGKLSPQALLTALQRHLAGDWGNVCEEDRQANDAALAAGTRLLSVYRSEDGVVFWTITEADRSVTTTLLPEDY